MPAIPVVHVPPVPVDVDVDVAVAVELEEDMPQLPVELALDTELETVVCSTWQVFVHIA